MRLQLTLSKEQQKELNNRAISNKMPMNLYAMSLLFPEDEKINNVINVFRSVIDIIDSLDKGEEFCLSDIIRDNNIILYEKTGLYIWLYEFLKENRPEILIIREDNWKGNIYRK